jgi:hypothetical protein
MLCSLTHAIYSADTSGNGWVQLNYEQFMKVRYVRYDWFEFSQQLSRRSF